MKTILWLDDIRNPFIVSKWIDTIQYLKEEYLKIENEACEIYWATTQTEFENYIKENGLPDLISFDNDLGMGNGEGYDCAKWLVNYCLDNNAALPQWYVHSANPVAQENISKLLENFENFEMEKKVTTWIARDSYGGLTFYETKPVKSIDDGVWVCSESDNITTLLGDEFLFKFPEVKWEDEEPTKVELTIKVCK